MLFEQKFLNQETQKFLKIQANCINECIKKNKFPNKLKAADITPFLQK